jgi:hypothetical protein
MTAPSLDATPINIICLPTNPQPAAEITAASQRQVFVAEDDLLRTARNAGVQELRKLVEALLAFPADDHVTQLVRRACDNGQSAAGAMEVLRFKASAAVAECLRVFPGRLTLNVMATDDPGRDAELLFPLYRLLKMLGPEACALAAAHGERSAAPETRYVSVLLAGETVHSACAELVASRLADPVPRVAWLASGVLANMRRRGGPRGAGVDALVPLFQKALEAGSRPERWAALRAATTLREPRLFQGLIHVLDCSDDELVESAHVALRELSGEDFGTRSRRWLRWWSEHQKV